MPDRAKILLAEDDEGWRDLLGSWLKTAGYAVEAVSDGKSVLPLARRFKPDCFLLDHELGDTTGHEICATLKSSPEFRETPIVIMTAHVAEFPTVVSHHPPDQFVAKTPESDELLLVLEALLAQK